MKKFGRRIMAMALAGAMMCAPMTAFAADTDVTEESSASGNTTGTGSLEGYYDSEVFTVVLPTNANNATFNFKLDPQKLLNKTNPTNYNDSTATVWFTDGSGKPKASISEAFTAKNKSNIDVDLSVTATTSKLTDTAAGYEIVMTDDKTFTDDSTTSVYLGLTVGSEAVAPIATKNADGDYTVTVSHTLDAVNSNLFEPVKDASGKYKLQLSSSATDTDFAKADITLTGACNSAADWSAVDDATTAAAPEVKLVWTMTKHVDGPQATMDSTGKITFTGLTADANIDGAKIVTSGSTNTAEATLSSDITWDDSAWTVADGGTLGLQLGSSYLSYYAGQTVTVKATLSDNSIITATATFPDGN